MREQSDPKHTCLLFNLGRLQEQQSAVSEKTSPSCVILLQIIFHNSLLIFVILCLPSNANQLRLRCKTIMEQRMELSDSESSIAEPGHSNVMSQPVPT